MIFIVALLLFGPKKLPEIGRSLGKAIGEFKRATNDLQRSLEEEVAATELKQTKRDLEDALKPGSAPPATPVTAPGAPAPSSSPAESSTVTVEPKLSATEPK